MRLYCDATVAINIAINSVQHDRTKYIEIDWHFIREKLDWRQIYLPYGKSQDKAADIFTKDQIVAWFNSSSSKLSIHSIYVHLEGSIDNNS